MVHTSHTKTSTDLQSRCPSCGKSYKAIERTCPACPTALLRADYPSEQFEPADEPGIFRYLDWLPPPSPSPRRSARRSSPPSASPRPSASTISTSGSMPTPPRSAHHNPTGSFKDFEALPTLLFLREHGINSIVLASAGSTARAFAYAGIQLGFRIHIIVPEQNLEHSGSRSNPPKTCAHRCRGQPRLLQGHRAVRSRRPHLRSHRRGRRQEHRPA